MSDTVYVMPPLAIASDEESHDKAVRQKQKFFIQDSLRRPYTKIVECALGATEALSVLGTGAFAGYFVGPATSIISATIASTAIGLAYRNPEDRINSRQSAQINKNWNRYTALQSCALPFNWIEAYCRSNLNRSSQSEPALRMRGITMEKLSPAMRMKLLANAAATGLTSSTAIRAFRSMGIAYSRSMQWSPR